MSDRKKFLRSGARAVTGLAITAAAGVGALMLGTVQLPNVERDPHAIRVSTVQNGERSVICSGPFAELGADPSRPEVAVPVGEVTSMVYGDSALSGLGVSATDATSVSGAQVAAAEVEDPLAAAQQQRLESATLKGFVAASCVEPVNEQWLVGGGSTLGLTTTLTLANASAVPATTQISVFDENGQVDALLTAGVIVAPNSAQTVPLNGYAPNRERLAVRVTSTGAPVAASLGVARVDGIEPVGAATVTRQLNAATRLVIPGVTNGDDHDHAAMPSDVGANDRFPVIVRAIAPGTADGTASVAAIDAAGVRTELGKIDLASKAVGQLVIPAWPHDATAVIIDADVPVFAGIEGASNSESAHDFDWFAPAPEIAADVTTPAPVLDGGTLVIANAGEEDAEVTLSGGEAQTLQVPAGSAITVVSPGSVTITSTAPVYAGVRFLASAAIAGYPIQSRSVYGGDLTVFTR